MYRKRRCIKYDAGNDKSDFEMIQTGNNFIIQKISQFLFVLRLPNYLEVFQWRAEDITCDNKKDKIREELADVINYCVLMADVCGLDIDEIVLEKMKRNNEKYPVEKAKGRKEKYDIPLCDKYNDIRKMKLEKQFYVGDAAFMNKDKESGILEFARYNIKEGDLYDAV